MGDTDLYGMEIDVAAAAEEIRSIGKTDKGKSVDDVLGSFGLGAFAEQLKDLRLSMLLSETHVATQQFGTTLYDRDMCNHMSDHMSDHMVVFDITWLDAAGELLDTLPPGIDEAVAISKVVQFLKSPEYSHFQHIVFDTAPTGHTLRLLTLPDFLDKTIGRLQLPVVVISSPAPLPVAPPPQNPVHCTRFRFHILVSLVLALISPILHRETEARDSGT